MRRRGKRVRGWPHKPALYSMVDWLMRFFDRIHKIYRILNGGTAEPRLCIKFRLRIGRGQAPPYEKSANTLMCSVQSGRGGACPRPIRKRQDYTQPRYADRSGIQYASRINSSKRPISSFQGRLVPTKLLCIKLNTSVLPRLVTMYPLRQCTPLIPPVLANK